MWKGRLWIIITLCLSYCLLKKISHDPIDKRKNRLMEYKPLHQRFNCQIKKRKEKHTYNDIRRSEKKRPIIIIKLKNRKETIYRSLLEHNQTRLLSNIFINRTKSNARAHTSHFEETRINRNFPNTYSRRRKGPEEKSRLHNCPAIGCSHVVACVRFTRSLNFFLFSLSLSLSLARIQAIVRAGKEKSLPFCRRYTPIRCLLLGPGF